MSSANQNDGSESDAKRQSYAALDGVDRLAIANNGPAHGMKILPLLKTSARASLGYERKPVDQSYK